MRGLTFLLLAVLLSLYTDAAFTDEQLDQLYEPGPKGTSEDSYASIKDLNMLKDRFRALESLGDLDMFEDSTPEADDSSDIIESGVRKRPFCNGFTGCGRINGKRTSLLLNSLRLSDSLHEAAPTSARAKRPFCNGFFGCGNPGKRIVIRHTYHPSRSIPATADKRAMCDSYGCRDSEDAFNHPLMQRMRTLLEQNA